MVDICMICTVKKVVVLIQAALLKKAAAAVTFRVNKTGAPFVACIACNAPVFC
jgi:hypothetical protein